MNTRKQVKIYIVEDNHVFASALKANIESAFSTTPLHIHIYETGEACIEKLKQEKPHVVILDYHLNGKIANAMDGVQVLDIIKKEKKEIYVIMVTGDDNIEIALKSFKHGASDYIVKSDTQFRKIIFSLFNAFKIMKSKSDSKKYKNILIAALLGLAILCGMLLTFAIFRPSFLI